MFFDPNRTHFPSYAHRYIYRCGVLFMPTQISLRYIAEPDKAALMEFCRFRMETQEKMFENPEAFGIDTLKLEETLNGLTLFNAMTVARTKNQTERMEALRIFQHKLQSIESLTRRLFSLQFDGENAFLTTKENTAFLQKWKNNNHLNSAEINNILQVTGFELIPESNRVVWKNRLYPQLFLAIQIFIRAMQQKQLPKQCRVYEQIIRFGNFQIIHLNQPFSLQDYSYCMSDNEKAFIQQVGEFLEKRHLRLTFDDCSTTYRLSCHIKNITFCQFVYTIDNSEFYIGHLHVFMNPKLTPGEIRKTPELLDFESRVRAHHQADQLIPFIQRNRNACRKCGIPSCCGNVHPKNRGYAAEIFGKICKICCGIYRIRIQKFTPQYTKPAMECLEILYDMQNIKK